MSFSGIVWIFLGIIAIIAVFFFLAILGFGLVLIIGASASAKSSAKKQATTAPEEAPSSDNVDENGSKDAECETAGKSQEEQASDNS